MIKIYKSIGTDGEMREVEEIVQDSWVDLIEPTEEEINLVGEKTKVDTDLIRKMLDDDEIPRLETSKNATMVVIDVPTKISGKNNRYVTNPIGIIQTTNRFMITVSPKNAKVLEDFRADRVKDFRTAKKVRFLIQILNATAAEYIKILDGIYRELETRESRMQKSTSNQDLIKLLRTEKTLVYFTSSLKENQLVLERLEKGIIFPLFDDDRELLEDAQIEYHQAIDMAAIYREIITSMSNTYSTITSNNLNNTMKFLAGVTIVLSIPTMLSSFFGMNVTFGEFSNDPLAAWILFIASILLALLVAIILKKKNLL